MRAQSIFANSNMFWTWQQGYKYMRLDLEHSITGQQWAFHLGATGCQSSSVLRPPHQACRQPNTVITTLSLTEQHPMITLDLSQLLSGIALHKESRCLSLPTQKSCLSLFSNIGLHGAPSAFKLAPRSADVQ